MRWPMAGVVRLLQALLMMTCLLIPFHLHATVCEGSDDTGGVGLTLKIPVTYEKVLNTSLSAILRGGLEGNMTAFTSDFDATNAGFFAHLELRVYPRPRHRDGWLGLFAAQKALYTNNGTKFEPEYNFRSVTSVGFIVGYKVLRKGPATRGTGNTITMDVFFDIEMAVYRNVTRGCFKDYVNEYRMGWVYFGLILGIGNM